MATCDLLQPVVVLTDVLDSKFSDIERSQASNMEQTEPLDLCLNGSIVNGFTMEYCTKDDRSLDENDDVVFVKEFTVKEKAKKWSCHKVGSKGEPRRNPVRKARDKKRFKDFTDVSFEEDEANVDGNIEDSVEVSEDFILKGEDSEDWKLESLLRKTKPKRVFPRKFSHKLGRKRKLNKTKEEKKVKLGELESLIESNLLSTRDYISDVKVSNKLLRYKNENRTDIAVDIFKRQVILLAVVKGQDLDLYKFINDE